MEQKLYTQEEVINYAGISVSKLFKLKNKHPFGKIYKNKTYYTEEEREQIYLIVNRKRIENVERIRTALKETYPITIYDLWIYMGKFIGLNRFKNLIVEFTIKDSNLWEDDENNLWYKEPL